MSLIFVLQNLIDWATYTHFVWPTDPIVTKLVNHASSYPGVRSKELNWFVSAGNPAPLLPLNYPKAFFN